MDDMAVLEAIAECFETTPFTEYDLGQLLADISSKTGREFDLDGLFPILDVRSPHFSIAFTDKEYRENPSIEIFRRGTGMLKGIKLIEQGGIYKKNPYELTVEQAAQELVNVSTRRKNEFIEAQKEKGYYRHYAELVLLKVIRDKQGHDLQLSQFVEAIRTLDLPEVAFYKKNIEFDVESDRPLGIRRREPPGRSDRTAAPWPARRIPRCRSPCQGRARSRSARAWPGR